MAKLLLTLDEVAEALSFDRRTVERMIAAGTLPAVYPRPRSPRVRRSDLESYVEGLSGPYTVTGPHAQGRSVCKSAETGSTGATIRRSGGEATSPETGGGLAALLGYDAKH